MTPEETPNMEWRRTKLVISRIVPMLFMRSYIIADGYSEHYGEPGRTSWWQWRGRQFAVRHRLLTFVEVAP